MESEITFCYQEKLIKVHRISEESIVPCVVECSERTVLSCLEPVCLCWRRFRKSWLYFQQ